MHVYSAVPARLLAVLVAILILSSLIGVHSPLIPHLLVLIVNTESANSNGDQFVLCNSYLDFKCGLVCAVKQ